MEARRKNQNPKPRFWRWVAASIFFRLVLVYFAKDLNLATRPEVSTPVTSLRRLAEGYWLKQSSMSPYAGSMYHGSPLLLAVLGPLTENKTDGQSYQLCSLVSVIADIISALLIRAIGQSLQMTYEKSLKSLGLGKLLEDSEILPSGDIAALVYLWNPFTIVTCMGFNTTPIENMFVLISIYGACKGGAPLAAFGWTIASHLSFYPLVLVVPVILLLGYGPDAPPKKLFSQSHSVKDKDLSLSESNINKDLRYQKKEVTHFSWRPITVFLLWAFIWTAYLLGLCGIFMQEFGGLQEMLKRTCGFVLTVKDLSPNIGVLWYFFAEVFDFFRSFFLMVFHGNILFMIPPLAIRLYHRPCFLAFVYMTICSMLKSYPSVGDSALYLGLLALFINELSEMSFSFFLFCGYVGVSLLSPVMHNLWIWRGTGNANFYFATAMAYACFQVVLVVESVSSTLSHDRKIGKLIKISNA